MQATRILRSRGVGNRSGIVRKARRLEPLAVEQRAGLCAITKFYLRGSDCF